MFESDSLIAVNEISKKKASFCEWDNIISDILQLSVECDTYSFNRRIDIGEHRIWRNSLPPTLIRTQIMFNDSLYSYKKTIRSQTQIFSSTVLSMMEMLFLP